MRFPKQIRTQYVKLSQLEQYVTHENCLQKNRAICQYSIKIARIKETGQGGIS